MDQDILADIFTFLKKERPELGDPDIILLGGSQASPNRQHVMPNSDYDILVIFPAIPYAESFTFTSDDQTRVYDLILRDPPSLAYDVHRARKDGKGTLLDIATFSRILYDPNNQAARLQSNLRAHYASGPYRLTLDMMNEEISELRLNLLHICYIRNKPAYPANVAALCNQVGKLALRLSGRWTSSGKIAGRYLKEHMPDMRLALQKAFHDAIDNRVPESLNDLIIHELGKIFYSNTLSQPFLSPQIPYDFDPNPTCKGHASTAVRTNPDALSVYFQSTNPIALNAAITHAHAKLGTVITPLTSERFLKKPDEYFFALGRAIAAYVDIRYADKGFTLSGTCLSERVNFIFEEEPDLARIFELALRGNPAGLNLVFKETLASLEAPYPYLHRPSSPDMKEDPAFLFSPPSVSRV